MFIVLRRIIVNKQKGVGMVKIWKIGAWPGIGDSNTPTNKQRFIKYALEHEFVALGSAYVNEPIENFSDEELMDKIWNGLENKDKEPSHTKVKNRKVALRNFADVKTGAVILLYNRYEVYVSNATTGTGEDKSQETPYYFVKKPDPIPLGYTDGINIAPHRVAVKWKFEKRSFPADFSKYPYNRRFIPIKEKDLEETIKSEELKKYLERKLRD